jgi:cellulose synthase/poly-beta-1,6-N-acetylglucosamine synthase-like glycosyltransferase
MNNFIFELVFWCAIGALFYTYLGYPALIWLRALLRPHPPRALGGEPMVTVVVVAHDEGPRIEARILNLLSLDYPRERIEIVIASDGSHDDTARRARRFEKAGVRVINGFRTHGKPAMLNSVVPAARGEIVVLADARQRFDSAALRALVAPFADPRVGAVSGELVLTPARGAAPVGAGVGAYWRYEKWIRNSEGRVASTVGATGAIYAIRRRLFECIREDTLLDDVLIPLRIVRRGYRVIFAPGAIAWDTAAGSEEEEFQRKVRTLAGNFQLFARERWLWVPGKNPIWFQAVSHKALRLAGPLLLAAAFLSSAALAREPLYLGALCGQAVLYAAAFAGRALRGSRRKLPLLALPYVFCLLNGAVVLAFVRFVTGRQKVTWRAPPLDVGGAPNAALHAR